MIQQIRSHYLQVRPHVTQGGLKSAGMLMPMGYLIGNGYVTVQGDMSDTETLRTTINDYFDGSTGAGNAASIPESGALYSGYDGASRVPK